MFLHRGDVRIDLAPWWTFIFALVDAQPTIEETGTKIRQTFVVEADASFVAHQLFSVRAEMEAGLGADVVWRQVLESVSEMPTAEELAQQLVESRFVSGLIRGNPNTMPVNFDDFERVVSWIGEREPGADPGAVS